MLILTRRVGETVMIGDDIQVVILGVKGNQVRVGIEAPTAINIVREELLTPDLVKEGQIRLASNE